MSRVSAVVLGLFLVAAARAWAEAPKLGLPLRCTPGEDCWIANYVDHDPGGTPRDYRCGDVTYHGHDGTDLAISDRGRMEEGVEVLAAAPGLVVGTRDGMADRSVRETGTSAVNGRECGNGVLIEHGDGWATQYCHMRQGSVRVHRGQRVERGSVLGLVGMSGESEFPHLHLTVRHDNVAVDPFVGLVPGAACAAGIEPLWAADVGQALAYRTGEVFNIGFAAQDASWPAARNGAYRNVIVPRDAAAITFWCETFATEPGDRITLRILAPDGRLFVEHAETINRHQAVIFRSVGRRRPNGGFSPGTYRGEVTYEVAADHATHVKEIQVKVD